MIVLIAGVVLSILSWLAVLIWNGCVRFHG